MTNFIVFCLIGALAATTHFVVVTALVEIYDLKPITANGCGFLCAFVVSFIGHFNLTFRSQKNNSLHSPLVKWMVVSFLGFGINQSLYAYLLQTLPKIHYLFLLGVVCAITALVTYTLGRLWAFRGKNGKTSYH